MDADDVLRVLNYCTANVGAVIIKHDFDRFRIF